MWGQEKKRAVQWISWWWFQKFEIFIQTTRHRGSFQHIHIRTNIPLSFHNHTPCYLIAPAAGQMRYCVDLLWDLHVAPPVDITTVRGEALGPGGVGCTPCPDGQSAYRRGKRKERGEKRCFSRFPFLFSYRLSRIYADWQSIIYATSFGDTPKKSRFVYLYVFC